MNEIACIFLGDIALASIITMRVEKEKEVSINKQSRDSR